MEEKKDKVQYWGVSNIEMMLIALTQVATNLFNVIMYMATYMATGGWGLSVMVASSIAAGMRVFDGITDPVCAWFSPKVRTKWGVATPQVFLGWILEVIAIFFLFNIAYTSKSKLLYILLYAIHILGYTMLNIGIGLYKQNCTNDPKKRPLFQRYNQTFVMLCSMCLTLYRSKILVPKYGGLKPGAFAELSWWVLGVASVFMIIGMYTARRIDKVEEFERNYHGATKFNLKDIWNLVAHNRAFLTEFIASVTDKIASTTAGNSAIQTLLFGIIIADYGFSGNVSIFTTIVTIAMIWSITGSAGRRGTKDAYLKWCWASIFVAAANFLFLRSVDPTAIPNNTGLKIVFIILYCVMSSFKSTTGAAVNSMSLDIRDYEFYLHGKYLGPLVGSVGSILGKAFDSLSNIIVAACIAVLGYTESMPQPGDPSSSKLFYITMFLWLGMPVLGYLASIIVMKWYPLDAETMEKVQAHNNELRAQNAARFEAEKAAKSAQ